MALIFNGNLPKISGNIKIEVPTPAYSGTASSNADDSINPYTGQGPGAGGAGQTITEIASDRAGVVLDPLFDNVSLLLQATGSIGETSFADSGPKGKIITNHNSVAITDTDSIFGGKSFQFNGINQLFSIPQDGDFVFAAGEDYTIEFWVKATGGRSCLGIGDYVGSSGVLWMYDFANNINASAQFSPNSSSGRLWIASAVVKNNVWFHYALVNDGNTRKLFYNGILQSSITNTSGGPALNSNNFVYIGAGSFPAATTNSLPNPGFHIQGFMDQIRITKGVARYTVNFTPPTEPF